MNIDYVCLNCYACIIYFVKLTITIHTIIYFTCTTFVYKCRYVILGYTIQTCCLVVRVCVRERVCDCVCVCKCVHACMLAWVHLYQRVWVGDLVVGWLNMSVGGCVWMCVDVSVSVCVHACACMHVYTYVQAHKLLF